MNGKGSKPRPFSVSHEVFQGNWERIFSKGEGREKKKRKGTEAKEGQGD